MRHRFPWTHVGRRRGTRQMTPFGWPMLLANFRECQRSALDGNRGEEVVAILISPYYRPWNGKWEEIMNGWSANRPLLSSAGLRPRPVDPETPEPSNLPNVWSAV